MTLIFFEQIKERILEKYPSITVTVTADDSYIIFSIDNEKIYYSSDFQLLIAAINIDTLWPKGVYNVLFIVEEKRKYEQIQFHSVDNNDFLNFINCTQIKNNVEKTIYQSYTIDMYLGAA